MDWRIFCFVLAAGAFFGLVVFALETSSLSGMGVRENLRDLWQAFFGKPPDDV